MRLSFYTTTDKLSADHPGAQPVRPQDPPSYPHFMTVPPLRPSPTFDQSEVPGRPGQQLPEALPDDPLPLVVDWYTQARNRAVQPNPDAMTIATVDPDGRISARIVLCKKIDPRQGFFEFFTNYSGRKGVALGASPRAALVMHWDAMDKQVRVEGPVVRSPGAASDSYFASRPWSKKVGAWASDQSRPVGSREEMLGKVAAAMRRFGLDPDRPPPADALIQIPRPPHWGGYRVYAERVELWVAGAGRVHDRAVWTRELKAEGEGFRGGAWVATRLQP